MSQAAVAPTPTTKGAVAFLKIPKDGAPYLAGAKCRNCGEVYVGEREVCGKCFARGKMDAIKLADRGKLYNFTVVHRNFPGVKVPFISAIVDLDGGGTLKGNLVDIEPDIAKLKFDMPVKVVFRDAGRQDKVGNKYLAYFFIPA